jgi:hypothetical protein
MEEKQRQRLTGINRYWLLALDSASRASLHRNGGSPRKWLATLRSGDAVKVEKFLAGIHLINSVVPGFETRCAQALLDFKTLPIPDQQLDLIGAGLGQNVFVFNSSQGRMVMKIDRESQALSLNALLDEARRIKTEHEKIRDWYATVPGFIPHESFCIVNGPLKGRRALATFQPYVADKLRGLFEDFEHEELVSLLRWCEPLHSAFVLFARRVIEIFAATGECIDLLGDRNLCIRGDENPTLYFVDPHDIYGPRRISRYPGRAGAIEDRLVIIEDLLRAVTAV